MVPGPDNQPLDMYTGNLSVPLDAAFVVAEADKAEGGGSARETQGDFSPVNMLFRPQMLGRCQVLRSASGKLQSTGG